jgi:MoaA/NifB/PqqE/SkfB family radical SAM enzyme
MIKNKIILDEANTNKQLRHYDSSGDYIRLSVDETIARNLNQWDGWSCSAGVNGLYIDFDGNVWICNTANSAIDRFNYDGWETTKINTMSKVVDEDRSEVYETLVRDYRKREEAYKKLFLYNQVPGVLGNIFDGFKLPDTWTKCKWKSCGCGADVFLAKVKTDDRYDLLSVYQEGYTGQHKTKENLVDNVEFVEAVELNFPMPYQVLWDLGRKCNYDCSYCWSSVHNKDAKHKPLDILISTIDKIISKWANDKPIRWNFGGGEPTLHPNFMDVLEYLKFKKQWVLVTTNGSRPDKYWKEAAQYVNSINLSVHFEYAEEEKVLKNIKAICDHFDEHDDDHWLEIKLMASPQHFDRAINFKKEILFKSLLSSVGANNRIKGVVSIVPIRSLGDSGTVVEYSEEQLSLIQQQ